MFNWVLTASEEMSWREYGCCLSFLAGSHKVGEMVTFDLSQMTGQAVIIGKQEHVYILVDPARHAAQAEAATARRARLLEPSNVT
jgi:hypothetical protein